jgi:hypothetical protein
MLNRLIIIFLILAGCHSIKKTTDKKVAQVDYASQNYSKGVIKDIELDGCRYLIELQDGKRLNPDKLDTLFQHDQLKVWVKFKIHDRMNICMSGTTVDIIDIQKREE